MSIYHNANQNLFQVLAFINQNNIKINIKIFRYPDRDNVISYCSVINNIGTYIINALLDSSLIFFESIFQGNQIGTLFYNDTTSSIALINCWISSYSCSIGINPSRFKETTEFTIKYDYFITKFCNQMILTNDKTTYTHHAARFAESSIATVYVEGLK